MLLASLQNISKAYGGQQILAGVSFNISSGRRLGLIGPNGSGKTTILRILAGEIRPDEGKAVMGKGIKLGYVPQHVEFNEGQTVMDCLLEAYRPVAARLDLCEHELAGADEAGRPEALRRYQAAQDAHERMGGYSYPQRAGGMLDALGLPGRAEQLIGSLSGGEKNVLALSRALLAEPDLLLLDEPANHLDYLGVAWLENFLLKFSGSVLIVSHNRYLLDRVVQGVFHLEHEQVKYYDGGYSAYQTARLRDLLAQQADYKANQKRLTRMETQLRRMEDQARNRADPKLGRRVRARRTRFEREKEQAIPKPELRENRIKVDFRGQLSQADIALQLRNYSRSFGGLSLFEDAEADIYCGERVALVGTNGCGKSTLLKDILKDGSWENPNIRIGPSLSVGYCAQEQEVLRGSRTVLDAIHAAGDLNKQEALGMLARFRFRGDDIEKAVTDLSGGERNRLQLARLMVAQPNFLILDEPTNHLDIPMREAVEEALDDFKGTLLVVSHDRYFLDKVVNRVLEVRDRMLMPYGGNFSDFWQTRQMAEGTSGGRIISRGRERLAGDQKKRRPNPQKVKRIEGLITLAEEKKTDREARMLRAYQDGNLAEGGRLAEEVEKLNAEIESLYADLLALEE